MHASIHLLLLLLFLPAAAPTATCSRVSHEDQKDNAFLPLNFKLG
jgi:hypothetical protein